MYPGDQHLPANDKSGQPNPFTPQQPSITRMSAQEIATLQAKLDRQLGPEYISDRPGAGGAKVQYLEAWKCINLANEIFGFNGWSSSIQNVAVDYMDENRESGRVSLGLSVVVRVTLRDGVFHEDIGYGSIDNAKSKAAAFEKCKKEGTTDALKRALRNFGNVLGNCLYDKSYLREVSKIKMPAPRFDVNHLHRRPEFTPSVKAGAPARGPYEKQEPTVFEAVNQQSVSTSVSRNLVLAEDPVFQDQFDDDYFDDYDFEDRPVLVESPRLNEFDTNTLPSITPPALNLPPPMNDQSVPPTTSFKGTPPQQGNGMHPPQPQNPARHPQPPPAATSSRTNTRTNPSNALQQPESRPPYGSPQNPVPMQQQPIEQVDQMPQSTVGFARITKDGSIASPFDPKSVNSPIGRTSNGVDPNKSTPIPRPRVTKVPLGNNSDVHNRMGQIAQMGPGGRKVGCPPSGISSPGKVGFHTRSMSGSSLAGAKRNAQGQLVGNSANGRPVGDISGQMYNQGMQGMQGVNAQPDPKRTRS